MYFTPEFSSAISFKVSYLQISVACKYCTIVSLSITSGQSFMNQVSTSVPLLSFSLKCSRNHSLCTLWLHSVNLVFSSYAFSHTMQWSEGSWDLGFEIIRSKKASEASGDAARGLLFPVLDSVSLWLGSWTYGSTHLVNVHGFYRVGFTLIYFLLSVFF